MTLGARIKEYRIKRGYTQSQMAAKLNMTEANFSSYERDKSVPPSEKLSQIASILNVSSDYLLGRTSTPTTLNNNDDHSENKIPDWASSKDIRDFKKMLEDDAPVMFDGVPIEGEARRRVMDILTGLFWEAKQMNKTTYGRKKRKDDSNEEK